MDSTDLETLRDRTNSEAFAVKRAERAMETEARELADKLTDYGHRLEDAEQRIEADVRAQHSGKDPENALSWRANGSPRDSSNEPS